MSAVWKVSSHFEYLENWSHGLDVTWQPVRGDLIAHPWTLSRRASQLAVRCHWLSLCTVWPLHLQWPCGQVSFTTMRLPILQLCAGFFGKASYHPVLSAPLQPRFGSLGLLAFPKAKIAIEREEICEFDGHTVHKLSQRRLTADW